MAEPDAAALDAVRRALAEDCAADDATTRLLGTAAARPALAEIRAEADCVVAGLRTAALVFHTHDAGTRFEARVDDGAAAGPGELLATVRGIAGALLSAERVALNFLQRLTGIATITRRAVEAVAGTGTRITHTRKTTPGLRALEIDAVLAGGGVANRASLADAVMWKDNHWALMNASGLALRTLLAGAADRLPVIVEVETEDQLGLALAAGATHLLIDNQPPAVLADWARRVPDGVTIQASGGITLANVADYAGAGAHLVSIGFLTHSAPAVPITMALRLME